MNQILFQSFLPFEFFHVSLNSLQSFEYRSNKNIKKLLHYTNKINILLPEMSFVNVDKNAYHREQLASYKKLKKKVKICNKDKLGVF